MPEVRVLGPLDAYVDGARVELGGPRPRAVLAMLLCARGSVVSADRLAYGLWGDEPPPTARTSLRTYVSRLRRSLEPGRAHRTAPSVLVGAPPGYALRLPDEAVDAWRFEHLLAAARAAARTRPREAQLRTAEALDLWRGPAYAEVADEPWATAECARLDEQRLAATELWIAATLRLGGAPDAVPAAEALTRDHPLREEGWRLMAVALWASDRPADALAAIRRCRSVLADEVGLDPGPALVALERAILDQRTEVLAEVVGPASVSVPRQLPAPPGVFVGRTREVAWLDAALPDEPAGPATVVLTALAGTAGVGKTALALHWAHRVAGRFPDGQLYVNLRGFGAGPPVAPAEAVRGFLDALGVAADRVPSGLDARAALYRSLLSGRRMLVVLDNARDERQVRPLLPGGPGALVLVTSRHRLSGLVVADSARPISLDLLTADESRALLVHRLGAARVEAEPDAVEALIAAGGHLPLALAIVAARAAVAPDRGLAVLAAELGPGLDRFSGTDSATDLRSVFSWSYEALGPPAGRLFRLLGVHSGPDIGVPAAASLAGVARAEARRLLGELAAAHLVHEAVPGRYAQHDLLAAYAAELGRVDPERVAARRRVLSHYVHTGYAANVLLVPLRQTVGPPAPEPGVVPEPLADDRAAMGWFAAEHRVLVRAVALADAARLDALAWHLAWTLSEFLDRAGHWPSWAATQATAVRAARRAGDPRWEAYAQRTLARAYARLGRPHQAMPRLRAALALFAGLGDHRNEANTCLALSAVHDQFGEYAEALVHTRRALDLAGAAGSVTARASALNNLGWLHSRLGDHARGLPSCAEALRLHQSAGNAYGQAAAWDSLGRIHQGLGDLGEADRCFRQALTLTRQLDDGYYEAQELTHLAANHRLAGETARARQRWEEALVIFDRLDHPYADDVRKELAQL